VLKQECQQRGTFNSRLKTSLAFNWHWHYLPPAARLWSYDLTALYKSIIIISIITIIIIIIIFSVDGKRICRSDCYIVAKQTLSMNASRWGCQMGWWRKLNINPMFAFSLLIWVCLVCFWCIFSCLFWVVSIPVQVIACKDRLVYYNDLLCVERDIKLYSLT